MQTVAVEPVYTGEVANLKSQIDAITKQISELNIKIKVGDDQLALLKDQRFLVKQRHYPLSSPHPNWNLFASKCLRY